MCHIQESCSLPSKTLVGSGCRHAGHSRHLALGCFTWGLVYPLCIYGPHCSPGALHLWLLLVWLLWAWPEAPARRQSLGSVGTCLSLLPLCALTSNQGFQRNGLRAAGPLPRVLAAEGACRQEALPSGLTDRGWGLFRPGRRSEEGTCRLYSEEAQSGGCWPHPRPVSLLLSSGPSSTLSPGDRSGAPKSLFPSPFLAVIGRP